MLVERGFGPAGKVPVRAETVVSGLETPWAIAFLPGGDFLVTERPGRIRLVRGSRVVPRPVAVVPVDATGEGGLMGLAVDPAFTRTRAFFIYYTAPGRKGRPSENVIERWRLSQDRLSATREAVVLSGIAAARYHDGGRLRFGPDGMLYAGTGDAGEPARSRDPGSPNGKLLRLLPDGRIPADNPVAGAPWVLRGLRNVQGFDWLPGGRMVVADHGPSGELGRLGHDEINVARPGDDLGWPGGWACRPLPGTVAPALVWRKAVPPGGAAYYRGSGIPEWRNSILVGTLGSRHLHRVVLAGDQVAAHEVYFEGDPPEGLGRLRDVVVSPSGEIYVATSNCDGRGRCPPEGDRIVRVVHR